VLKPNPGEMLSVERHRLLVERTVMNRRPHWATSLTLFAALAAGTALIAMAAPAPADDGAPSAPIAQAATPAPEIAR
jgi:hypothetical protein